jgi:hypothetical protein
LKEITATTQSAECSEIIVTIAPAIGRAVSDLFNIKKYFAIVTPHSLRITNKSKLQNHILYCS